MSAFKEEPEGTPTWEEGSTVKIMQEGHTNLSEDTGIDDGTVQVTVHMEEDEFLTETTENEITAVSKDDSSDLEDAGCSKSPPLEVNSSRVRFSITHPMYLRGTSSNNTGPSAPSSELIVNDDSHTQLNSSSQLEALLTGSQRNHFSQVSEGDNIQVANELTVNIRESQYQLSGNSNRKSDLPEINFAHEKSLQSEFCKECFSLKSPCNHDQRTLIERQFPYLFCEKSLHCRSDCKNHTDEKPFKCQFCEKLFKTSNSCKIHEKTHTGVKPFNCQFCEKSFTRSDVCKYHEMTHTGEKSYKCQFCERMFYKKQHCQSHELIHTGERPFKCQFCEKSFNRKQYMKRHEMTHTGEKPFKCQICQRSFIKKQDWKIHEMAHASEEPCECKFCGKFFTKKWNCKLHEMTHSGEKPFKCQFCEKTFKKEKKCKKHERTHVDDEILDIPALEGVSHFAGD
ncbi:hypothetical protein HOLleu_26982 [Holothuria leucospilota]|uniref:C2H2-type domain-containing protein n=1 Tax=Holothuria leucospilota TaxID=206669 RepID=A0A9Q1BPP1_HOLLE|nr:hypothetical protein HOLleu_26982 [Holothuria leucospilota]